MVAGLIHVGRLLIVLASRHRTLVLENVVLRQQLAVYRSFDTFSSRARTDAATLTGAFRVMTIWRPSRDA